MAMAISVLFVSRLESTTGFQIDCIVIRTLVNFLIPVEWEIVQTMLGYEEPTLNVILCNLF